MDHRHFSFFSESVFYTFLHRWHQAERMILPMSVGDIFFFVDPALGESVLHVALERTVVRAGSAAWFDAPYDWFRWLYRLMRVHGFHEPRWELLMRANYSVVLPTVSFIDQLRALYPHLRVSYPQELDQSLLIHNRQNSTYMRIKAFTGEEALDFAEEISTYGVSSPNSPLHASFDDPIRTTKGGHRRRRGSPLPAFTSSGCVLEASVSLGSSESLAKKTRMIAA